MWTEHHFLSYDGAPMLYRRLAAKEPRATILIVHGMGEHGGRYEEFAAYLAGRGFTCYLPDLRGFGKSAGKRGCLRRFEDYFRDLESVRTAMDSREGALSAFVLGHSYGGLIIANYLAEHPEIRFKAMVLTSPNFGIAIRVPVWRRVLGKAASVLFPDLTQPTRVDRNTLTHDAVLVEKNANDPLVHSRISARLYTELTNRISRSQEMASKITLPSFLLQAGDDRVVSREATTRFFEGLSSKDKKLQICEGLFHEILNETTRQSIYAQIGDWLSSRA